jgi:hypothetical protein
VKTLFCLPAAPDDAREKMREGICVRVIFVLLSLLFVKLDRIEIDIYTDQEKNEEDCLYVCMCSCPSMCVCAIDVSNYLFLRLFWISVFVSALFIIPF